MLLLNLDIFLYISTERGKSTVIQEMKSKIVMQRNHVTITLVHVVHYSEMFPFHLSFVLSGFEILLLVPLQMDMTFFFIASLNPTENDKFLFES